MKKLFTFLLIIFLVYFSARIYFLDKEYFLCPIEYSRDFIIRCDNHGNGFFAAGRSGRRLHQGIDLFAEIGQSIRAPRSGRVVAAQRSRGMGNFVIIKHSEKLVTIYGHLSRIDVRKGDFVRQGQVLGAVGKTGNANYRDIQPHLHFEVRKNGVPQDPLQYLG